MSVPSVTLSGAGLLGSTPVEFVRLLSAFAVAGTVPHEAVARALQPHPVMLGRKPPTHRPGTRLRLGAYLKPGYAVPPLPIDYYTKAMPSIARMYLNDTYGDCVIASAYHQVGVWTGNESGTPVVGTDNEVQSMYHTICGPGDNGCVIEDVLKYARDRGLPFNGVVHKIDGYVEVD